MPRVPSLLDVLADQDLDGLEGQRLGNADEVIEWGEPPLIPLPTSFDEKPAFVEPGIGLYYQPLDAWKASLDPIGVAFDNASNAERVLHPGDVVLRSFSRLWVRKIETAAAPHSAATHRLVVMKRSLYFPFHLLMRDLMTTERNRDVTQWAAVTTGAAAIILAADTTGRRCDSFVLCLDGANDVFVGIDGTVSATKAIGIARFKGASSGAQLVHIPNFAGDVYGFSAAAANAAVWRLRDRDWNAI